MFLAFATNAAHAEIYKWVDEEGNVHYSDCPPPPTCQPELIEPAPGPTEAEVQEAEKRLDELLEQQKESQALREKEKLVKELRKITAMQEAAERRRICLYARQNLVVLQQRRPVYTVDEDGERIYLDDKSHKAEIERMRELIAENCRKR